MKKAILIIILACVQVIILNGQEAGCQKLNVGVYFIEIGDSVVSHLNKKYGVQSTQEWLDDIDNRVIEVLQVNSPEIIFFSSRIDKTTDPDYTFRYILHLTAINGKMLIPPDSVIYIEEFTGYEVTDYTDPEFEQETAFWMAATLVVNSPSVPCLQWVINVELASDLELQGVIQKQSQQYCRDTKKPTGQNDLCHALLKI